MIARMTAEDRASRLRGAAHKLEVALLALETWDWRHAVEMTRRVQASDRRSLVDVASMMLWENVVQREMCGVLDHREVKEICSVPDQVWERMDASPRKS